MPPNENGFMPGMKLEAVDKSNPSFIGVATIVEIDDDRVRIEFDGYKRSGYWTTYSDRDLFNAGWCHANGHSLRAPGTFTLHNNNYLVIYAVYSCLFSLFLIYVTLLYL